MTAGDTSADSSALCGRCAMCCNGTLFNSARLAAHEKPIRRGDGLKLAKIKGQTFFLQPCAYESCGRCTIYESRFEVCRAFKCALLRRYESGEVDFEEAQSTIAKALELRAAVSATDPPAVSYGERQRLRKKLAKELTGDTGPARDSIARRLLAMVVLDSFLDRWFWTRDKGGGAPNSSPRPSA
jgi:hypothetical protein